VVSDGIVQHLAAAGNDIEAWKDISRMAAGMWRNSK